MPRRTMKRAKHQEMGTKAKKTHQQDLWRFLYRESQEVRIYSLGELRVERNAGTAWKACQSSTWERQRARSLLGCLLSSRDYRLGREEVMEALWPDLDSDTAANRLHGAVRELRLILEPKLARPAESHLLRLEHDTFVLAGQDLVRSEERRVGKECRSRWSPYH